ncbi:MAG: hypothetical protein QME51_00225 [Planctomycetota bacterium]|nr:hypothetical protein [Planctomycetota bacterium]MDI6786785.1 hypothetical protein [Planctomycetota bacterium]
MLSNVYKESRRTGITCPTDTLSGGSWYPTLKPSSAVPKPSFAIQHITELCAGRRRIATEWRRTDTEYPINDPFRSQSHWFLVGKGEGWVSWFPYKWFVSAFFAPLR